MIYIQNRGGGVMEHKHFEGYSGMRRRCLRMDDDAEFGAELTFSEIPEDTTAYPEFIASFNNWTTYEKQKKRASELANMTDEDK